MKRWHPYHQPFSTVLGHSAEFASNIERLHASSVTPPAGTDTTAADADECEDNTLLSPGRGVPPQPIVSFSKWSKRAVTALCLSAVMGAVLCGCLVDRNNDGTYRIGIVGDSNTALADSRMSWVTFIENEFLLPNLNVLTQGGVRLEPVAWTNAALLGFSCVVDFYGAEAGVAWTTSLISGGADAIVSALGTNDLEGQLATPEEIVACYLDMKAAAASSNVPLFVATTPPVYPPYPDAEYWSDLTSQLNALVRATFTRVIDFDSGFTPDMYFGDGRHLNEMGEQLRAERVVAAIKAAQH